MFEGEDRSVEALLPAVEASELMKIKNEAGVVGFVLIDEDGKQLAAEGLSAGVLGPVFANAFDISDAIASELGESQRCPALFLSNDDYEFAAVRLSTCNALIVREKPKAITRGFADVR